MKVFLQQIGTGLYLQALAEWTIEARNAHDFKSSVTARKFCLRHGIEDAHIVLKFEEDKYDIVLPAPRKKADEGLPSWGAGG